MNGQLEHSASGVAGLFTGLIVVNQRGEQAAGQGVISSFTRAGVRLQSLTPMHEGDKVRLFPPRETELRGVVISGERDTFTVQFEDQVSAHLLRRLEASLADGEHFGRPVRRYSAEGIRQNKGKAVRDRHLIFILPFAIMMHGWFLGLHLAHAIRKKLTGSKTTLP